MKKMAQNLTCSFKSIKRATRDLRRSVHFVPENHHTQTLASSIAGKTVRADHRAILDAPLCGGE